MIILGIDPGLATTGYAVLKSKNNTLKVVTYGCIKTNPRMSIAQRLEKIYIELGEVIEKYRPCQVAIEKLFFAKNVKTALKVGEARGVVILASAKIKAPICEFTPLQVKLTITGFGQAPKLQIQRMVKSILGLEQLPRPDDAADALAIAICLARANAVGKK